MAKCSFCGKDIPLGTGFTLFKKTGESLSFCSRKCSVNHSMKRNSKNYKWSSSA